MSYHATTVDLSTAERAQLRAARERLGLSQTAVGHRAGCTYAMICYIESGAKSPSYGLLAAICAALGLELRLKLVKKR